MLLSRVTYCWDRGQHNQTSKISASKLTFNITQTNMPTFLLHWEHTDDQAEDLYSKQTLISNELQRHCRSRGSLTREQPALPPLLSPFLLLSPLSSLLSPLLLSSPPIVGRHQQGSSWRPEVYLANSLPQTKPRARDTHGIHYPWPGGWTPVYGTFSFFFWLSFFLSFIFLVHCSGAFGCGGRGSVTQSRVHMVVVGALRLVVDVCLVNQRDAVHRVVDDKLRMRHEVVDWVPGLWLLHAVIEGATEGIHHPDLKSNARGRGGGAEHTTK